MQSKNAIGILLGIAAIIIGGGFALNAIVSTYETITHPDYTLAATSTTVSVAAEILGTIQCTGDGSTDFGSWVGGDTSIKTSTPNSTTTMSCANSSSGCTLYVKDVGSTGAPGLWKSPDLIESPTAANPGNASDTISGGAEGYGIKAATTTTGTGATLGIQPRYRNTGANDIGALEITNTTIASSTATTSSREIVTTHMAAIAAGTPSGSYSDTITYECTAN